MTAPLRAGVMGWPVRHSLSPLLHGYWLRRYDIDGRYDAFEVPPDKFAATLYRLRDEGVRGVNVTIPHKEAALRAVDHADAVARRVGAVNTIVVEKEGTLFGTNTDGYGFIENLRERSSWRAEEGPAVVLGAGGAARAVVVALLNAGVPQIRLANRTRERALELARTSGDEVRVTVVAWEEAAAALDGAVLLVNTTSLGMKGNAPLSLSLNLLPRTAVVNDIVYAPLKTALLAAAEARGNGTVDGLGMLIHQARPGFEAWFGVRPEVTGELREMLERQVAS